MEGTEIWISFRRVDFVPPDFDFVPTGFDFHPRDFESLPRVLKVGKGRGVDRFGVAALQIMSFFRDPFRPSASLYY